MLFEVHIIYENYVQCIFLSDSVINWLRVNLSQSLRSSLLYNCSPLGNSQVELYYLFIYILGFACNLRKDYVWSWVSKIINTRFCDL